MLTGCGRASVQYSHRLTRTQRRASSQLHRNRKRLDCARFFPGYFLWNGDGHVRLAGEILLQRAIRGVEAAIFEICAGVWVTAKTEFASS